MCTKVIQQANNQCDGDTAKNELQKVEKYQISILHNIKNSDEECIEQLTKHFDNMLVILVNNCQDKAQKITSTFNKET